MQKQIYITYSLFFIFLIGLLGQEPFYVNREKIAPTAIKNNLNALRQRAVKERWQFQVGYTEALNVPLQQLTGLQAPSDLETQIQTQNSIAMKVVEIDEVEKAKFNRLYPNKLPEFSVKPSPYNKTMDWRKFGKVTPVRNQLNCGSCWAFATVGAYEGNYLLRNNVTIDLSEQCVLNCSGAGSCSGGWWAFPFLVSKGCALEANYPYTANNKPCGVSSFPYQAITWGYVTNSSSVPSVAQLKQALCTHGPLAVAVYVSGAFQAYTGGVFNENSNNSVNHGVTLIGWDDYKGAWLIKNSWGTGWGDTCGYGPERGYMWISYNSCKIGFAAAWVKAESLFYKIPIDKIIIQPRIIIPPEKIKPPIKPY